MMQASRLERELVGLFGRSVVAQSGTTDPGDLPLSAEFMDRVHDAADALMGRSPREQRALVAALEPDTRLVLCMFIQDLELAATLALAAIRKAA